MLHPPEDIVGRLELRRREPQLICACTMAAICAIFALSICVFKSLLIFSV